MVPRLLLILFEDMSKSVSEDAGCHCSTSNKMEISQCGMIYGCSWAVSEHLSTIFIFYRPVQCYCHRKVALNIRYVLQERKLCFSVNFLQCLSAVSSLYRMVQGACRKIQNTAFCPADWLYLLFFTFPAAVYRGRFLGFKISWSNSSFQNYKPLQYFFGISNSHDLK